MKEISMWEEHKITKTFHEFHEYWGLIVNNKPGKKAYLSGEGVDVT